MGWFYVVALSEGKGCRAALHPTALAAGNLVGSRPDVRFSTASAMKIHAICLLRNEADVVEPCLRAAEKWADRIYLYDGASTDGTWEKVQAMKSDRIVPWRSDGKVFREGLRAEVFAARRLESAEGDWWCQLNADEFYVEDPRDFLAAVPRTDHVVWAVNVQYYFTHEDIAENLITGDFEKDRGRLRYYSAACAEPRFFRYRERLRWRDTDAWPEHMGVIHRRAMHFRHYCYRSPQQIQMRLDVRRENRARGFEGWDHAKEADWREKLVPRSALHRDVGDGRFVVEQRVREQYREPFSRRALKRFMHSTGLWP
jgi:glycosyltransferase involved in cell wall biosynthesis